MADFQFINLATKPKARICYSFHRPVSTTKPVLLVFLNGLGLPQVASVPVIAKLEELRSEIGYPAILTYDRLGQGQTTDQDPQDKRTPDPTHGHDCISAIKDPCQLIIQITSEEMSFADVDSLALVLVSNSIGCALARLYAQQYPGTVAGLKLENSVY